MSWQRVRVVRRELPAQSHKRVANDDVPSDVLGWWVR